MGKVFVQFVFSYRTYLPSLLATFCVLYVVTGLSLPTLKREQILNQSSLTEEFVKRIKVYQKLEDLVVGKPTSTPSPKQHDAIIVLGKKSFSVDGTTNRMDTMFTVIKSVNASVYAVERRSKLPVLKPRPTGSQLHSLDEVKDSINGNFLENYKSTLHPFKDENSTMVNKTSAMIMINRVKDVAGTTSNIYSEGELPTSDFHSPSRSDFQSLRIKTSTEVPSMFEYQQNKVSVIDHIPLIVMSCLLFILSGVPTYTLYANTRKI